MIFSFEHSRLIARNASGVARLARSFFVRALALLAVVSCSVLAHAQQTAKPPIATTTAVVTETRRPPAQASTRRPPLPRAPSLSRTAAPPVVAVVHRLSGWRLRAVVTPPDAPIVGTFDDTFVSTNIVAGYVLSDGRTVVVRLPQPEADMLSFTTAFPEMRPPPTADNSSLKLVRADGAQFDARFVGVDGSTGLSLLESSQPLQSPTNELRVVPSVGQRVCVWAPLPARSPAANASTQPGSITHVGANAPVGDEGVLYMSLSEIEGTLKAVRRSPSGRAIEFSVESSNVSPEWSGGVALTESGALVGIVDESGDGETTLLSAETVRAAAERVRSRRASVPQPWLGARGDAVATTPFDKFVEQGWSRDQALSLVKRQHGVLLTGIAPGSPAARAGLKPGDVIERVGAHDVRNVEDMTWLLKELGGNSPAQFTVLRGGNTLTMRVLLSEAQNPALETAQAEVFALEAALLRAQADQRIAESKVLEVESDLRRLDEQEARNRAPHHDTSIASTIERQRQTLSDKLRATQASFAQMNESISKAQRQLAEAQARLRAASAARPTFAAKPLVAFGVETSAFIKTTLINGVTKTQQGLVVIHVRPDSPAASAGLRVGDIIETVNDQPSVGVDWNAKLPAEPKSETTLGVLREGARLTLKLRLPALPQ